MQELRSLRELRLMRRAGLVVWRAHQEAARLVRPGITTQQLDAAIEDVFARFEAEPLFRGVTGKKTPFPAVSCVSVNEEVVHGIPGNRVLIEGDLVSIDTGCRLQGWCGDAAVTLPVGDISPQRRRLLDVTQQMLTLALERLTIDRRWSLIARRMQKFAESHGFSVVEDLCGHGIGRNLHEPPSLPNFDSPKLRKQDVELVPGLTVAIEPMVNEGSKSIVCRSDHWTYATADGRCSAHFEHTVALTESGVWILTGPPTTDEERQFAESR